MYMHEHTRTALSIGRIANSTCKADGFMPSWCLARPRVLNHVGVTRSRTRIRYRLAAAGGRRRLLLLNSYNLYKRISKKLQKFRKTVAENMEKIWEVLLWLYNCQKISIVIIWIILTVNISPELGATCNNLSCRLLLSHLILHIGHQIVNCGLWVAHSRSALAARLLMSSGSCSPRKERKMAGRRCRNMYWNLMDSRPASWLTSMMASGHPTACIWRGCPSFPDWTKCETPAEELSVLYHVHDLVQNLLRHGCQKKVKTPLIFHQNKVTMGTLNCIFLGCMLLAEQLWASGKASSYYTFVRLYLQVPHKIDIFRLTAVSAEFNLKVNIVFNLCLRKLYSRLEPSSDFVHRRGKIPFKARTRTSLPPPPKFSGLLPGVRGAASCCQVAFFKAA